VPWNLFIEAARFQSGPLAAAAVPWNDQEVRLACNLLCDRRLRVGIYAGLGCMNYAPMVTQLAELLQAPVATSMSGKGVIAEDHPLSVGWGYGPQGTSTAEQAFRRVDVVLAMGVKFSEVSTGFYSLPQHRHLIHVDVNPASLGRVMRTSNPVNTDTSLFLSHVLGQPEQFRRDQDGRMIELIRQSRQEEACSFSRVVSPTNVDPVAFLLALRRRTGNDAMAFVDVTMSQYWATEVFTAKQSRTFFNPTNNQSMGWSIPAALGAQRAFPGRQTVTVTGDGCFLMSAMEIATAGRAGLPVKFFVLDDNAYHYMQELQRPAYMRTTATMLANLDYQSLARGFNVAYQEISQNDELDARIQGVLNYDGPVLTRVKIDYGNRPVRWLNAARARFTSDLTREQKMRFAARIGYRSMNRRPVND
jgi:acetolactate synthase-1/2/3 large subunit